MNYLVELSVDGADSGLFRQSVLDISNWFSFDFGAPEFGYNHKEVAYRNACLHADLEVANEQKLIQKILAIFNENYKQASLHSNVVLPTNKRAHKIFAGTENHKLFALGVHSIAVSLWPCK